MSSRLARVMAAFCPRITRARRIARHSPIPIPLFTLTIGGTRRRLFNPSDKATYLIASGALRHAFTKLPIRAACRLLRLAGRSAMADNYSDYKSAISTEKGWRHLLLARSKWLGTWCAATLSTGVQQNGGAKLMRWLGLVVALLMPVTTWAEGYLFAARCRHATLVGHEPDRTARLPAAAPLY